MANELRADVLQFLNDTIERDLIRQAAAVLDVYVDGANGNDTNDGLSSGNALQTIAAVYQKFPPRVLQGGGIRVNLAGVGGFGTNATAQLDYAVDTLLVGGEVGAYLGNTYQYLAPEMVAFTPATGPATAALDAVPTVAVAGGSASSGGTLSTRFDFTAAAPGWTVNDFQGKAFLRITRAGAKVVWELPIASNTADTITVRVLGVQPLIQNTDTAEIVIPAVRFTGSADVVYNAVAVRGSGRTLDVFSAQGLGPNFVRCAWRQLYLLGREITFDRCILGASEEFNGSYMFKSSGEFYNCIAPFIYLLGFQSTEFYGIPLQTGAADPIVANRKQLMNLQVADASFPQMGLEQGTIFINRYGVAVDGAGGGAAGSLYVDSGALFYCTSSGGGYPLGAVQGIVAGANPAIVARRSGRAILFSNGTAGRTSLYQSGGGNPLSLPDAGTTVDYGTGVGDWEEAAGYDGVFWIAPAAGAPSDPVSHIRTR